MALKASAVLTFTRYVPELNGTVTLYFTCADPGAGESEEYFVSATDAEVTAITTLASAGTLALAKLNRKYRAVGIATKLDALIGQTVTVP